MTREFRIVIATAGRPALLPRTLTSLAACAQPDNYRETIVVENGKRAGAQTVVANCAPLLRARYMHVGPSNKNLALNAAIHALDDDCLVLFTDDDVRFAPDVLIRYADASAKHGRGHFFGGPFGVDRETPPVAWLEPYLPPSARGWNPAGCADSKDTLFLGFNWAAFAGDLREAGWFDPMFGPGSAAGAPGDEKEMQLRLLRLGVRPQLVADAMVWHYVPVERCTAEWTLGRDYRNAITKQLLAGGSRMKLAADLIRHTRKAWSRGLRAKFMSHAADAEQRFLTMRNLQRSRGQARGCRYLLFEHQEQPRIVAPTSENKAVKRAA